MHWRVVLARMSATLKRLSSCALPLLGKDGAMPSKRFDENTRAKAVWLVREHGDDYDSAWVAMCAIVRDDPGQ